MTALLERYADKIQGVLLCFDRVVITGTLPSNCHAKAMEAYLRQQGVRLFDYAHWAEPLREEIREHAERLAQEAGLEIRVHPTQDEELRLQYLRYNAGDQLLSEGPLGRAESFWRRQTNVTRTSHPRAFAEPVARGLNPLSKPVGPPSGCCSTCDYYPMPIAALRRIPPRFKA